MATIEIQLLSWLIAGSIASWLLHELSGQGSLGVAADWLASLCGAILGVFTWPLISWLLIFLTSLTGKGAAGQLDWWHSIESQDWWVSIIIAFLGALLVSRLFRTTFRVRRPTP